MSFPSAGQRPLFILLRIVFICLFPFVFSVNSVAMLFFTTESMEKNIHFVPEDPEFFPCKSLPITASELFGIVEASHPVRSESEGNTNHFARPEPPPVCRRGLAKRMRVRIAPNFLFWAVPR